MVQSAVASVRERLITSLHEASPVASDPLLRVKQTHTAAPTMSTNLPAIPFGQYAVDLSDAISRRDGQTAAAILNLQDQAAAQRIYQGLPYATVRGISDNPHLQEIKQVLTSSQLDVSGISAWSTVASKHIKAIVHFVPAGNMTGDQAASQGNYQKAFEAQLELSK